MGISNVLEDCIKNHDKSMVTVAEAREAARRKALAEYMASPFIGEKATLYFKCKNVLHKIF